MRVLAVAHRAGNDLAGLALAREVGADLVEADVHLAGDRLELHHLASLGPLPWRLDQRTRRWRLVPRTAPQLELAALLEAIGDGPGLLLDLKSDAMGSAVRAALQTAPVGVPVLACGNWTAVDALDGVDGVQRLLTAGTPRELAGLLARLEAGPRPDGVCVRRTLLDAVVVERLLARVETVLTWPVDDAAALADAQRFGVSGVISDDATVLRAVVAARD